MEVNKILQYNHRYQFKFSSNVDLRSITPAGRAEIDSKTIGSLIESGFANVTNVYDLDNNIVITTGTYRLHSVTAAIIVALILSCFLMFAIKLTLMEVKDIFSGTPGVTIILVLVGVFLIIYLLKGRL